MNDWTSVLYFGKNNQLLGKREDMMKKVEDMVIMVLKASLPY
jgi:hypothetical protein